MRLAIRYGASRPGFGVLLAGALTVFGPPLGAQERAVTLTEAIRLAEQVQPSVIQAQGSQRNASAQVRTARGAYLPNLTATTSGGTNFSESTRPDPVTGVPTRAGQGNTSVSLGLNTSVDLFTGFRRGADTRAARATEDAAEAGLIDARFQVALSTTQQFFDALATGALTRVREASVRRAEEQLKISVAKLAAGSATRSDSLRSLVTLGTARGQLITTEAQLAQAEAGLGQLIGVEGRVSAVDDASFYRPVTSLDTVALRQEAEGQSPSVQNASAMAAAARASLGAARAAYWPTLSLSAGTSWNGTSNGDYQLFNQRQLNLTMVWNIFNRFGREQTIVTRQTSLDVAEATAANVRRQVQSALTAQLALLAAAQARIDIATTSVQAAEEDLRVVRERYRLGAATIVDVLSSQEALTQSEVDVVNARFDYLRAKAQIEALIGRPL